MIFLGCRLLRYHSIIPSHNKLYCPCCNMRFRAFNGWDYKELTDNFNPSRYENTRQDVLCPICRALPRHRILAMWCEKNIERLKDKDILYFAAEQSMLRWMKRNGITVTTADLYATADLRLDIQNTGLPDASYDVVIANHVLEHVDDYKKALLEIRGILKPTGFLICSFPMDSHIEYVDEEEAEMNLEERIQRFGQHDHKRVFGMRTEELLCEAGYAVEVIDGETYPKEILPVIGPADYDMNRLFVCTKMG